jgi:hypothetical protein
MAMVQVSDMTLDLCERMPHLGHIMTNEPPMQWEIEKPARYLARLQHCIGLIVVEMTAVPVGEARAVAVEDKAPPGEADGREAGPQLHPITP